MLIMMPDFMDGPYYDRATGKLKKDAPQEVIDDYNDYLKRSEAVRKFHEKQNRRSREGVYEDANGNEISKAEFMKRVGASDGKRKRKNLKAQHIRHV